MPSRLNLGCGPDPLDGWDNLDVDPGIEGLAYCQSAVDLANIPTSTYDCVQARDIIEHLSWRDVRPALAEWLRVLKPGGELSIETPSARELGLILSDPDNPILPRWELLYDASGEYVGGDRNTFDWFNRVAYGHQDRPGYYHACYFTEEWLRELLVEAGAIEIETVFSDVLRFKLKSTKAAE
jgi:SAM-dependent methyltransferase